MLPTPRKAWPLAKLRRGRRMAPDQRGKGQPEPGKPYGYWRPGRLRYEIIRVAEVSPRISRPAGCVEAPARIQGAPPERIWSDVRVPAAGCDRIDIQNVFEVLVDAVRCYSLGGLRMRCLR